MGLPPAFAAALVMLTAALTFGEADIYYHVRLRRRGG